MAERHRLQSSKPASREATSSGENNEAQSGDGTHNTLASESQTTTSTSARKRSGLGTFGRLPPELRDTVYECMFDGEVEASSLNLHPEPFSARLLYDGREEKLRKALIPLQICGQMRDEAMQTLFRVLNIKLFYKRMNSMLNLTPIVPPTARDLKAWTELICKIPTHLRSPMMKFEYKYDCRLQEPRLATEYQIVEDGPLFTESISGLIKSVYPGRLSISILFYFRLGGPIRLQPGFHGASLHSLRTLRGLTEIVTSASVTKQ